MEAILTFQPQRLRNFIPALAQEHGPLTHLAPFPFSPAAAGYEFLEPGLDVFDFAGRPRR